MAAQLPTRQLGKDGPWVSALGYGAMGLSSTLYGDAGDEEERLAFLDKVFEMGCTFWDTAEGYGDNEELIGKWFKRTGKRDQVFLATKFAVRGLADGTRIFSNEPEYIRKAIDGSLERLQTDHVDLWYCHRFDGKVPVETIVSTMASAVHSGKVRYLGLSECSSTTLRRAMTIHPIHAVQIEYSPFTLDIENASGTNLLATCRELGVATVAYSPLGRGVLTGQYKSAEDFGPGDWRRNMPRFSAENFPKNLELVDKLSAIAKMKGCTTGQLTLAWLMEQGPDVIPIPGTKKAKYLEENLGSLRVVLSEGEAGEIREAVEGCVTSGDRYPGVMAKVCFGDTPELEGREGGG
ncbi:hypothetical protein HO133_003165 [Letharia lupina]|uniref:NADP-dependent oxidoreductase domain-containing protein n=1 Tax=Letharia lupina TaxID=560253 RepID=A0A8H6F9Y5_9LECA|nr:uncharacterized protein HO133_003165 [Letharia lupina]KAF6220732.1 hypothetical protein HO133_003165 [Letharia lupina]